MNYYIGLDAHSKTCTFVILSEEGEIVREGKVDTTERNLIGIPKSIEGNVSLVLEEANIAHWIYLTLRDHVSRIIVCHPAYLPKKSGAKTDYRDALHLALQLRAGNLTPVYHDDNPLIQLRAVVGHYAEVNRQLTTIINNYKAILRSEGIETESAYLTQKNEKKILEIKSDSKRMVAEKQFAQIQHLKKIKSEYAKEFSGYNFNMPMIRNLSSIPGVGSVRAHEIASFIAYGNRFENKHKLWSYAMLVRHQDMSDGNIVRRRYARGRSELKNAFIGAAQRAVISPTPSALKKYYEHLVESKRTDKRIALKAVARKIAAISLVIMKKGTKYNEELILKSF